MHERKVSEMEHRLVFRKMLTAPKDVRVHVITVSRVRNLSQYLKHLGNHNTTTLAMSSNTSATATAPATA